MPRATVKVFSFSYEASSRSLPRRRCTACGRRGRMVETLSSTNGGPQQQTLECRFCGASTTKALP